MNEYPALIVPVDHVEPVPRRVRAVLAGETVVDTIRARYVWERPSYPQYYIPVGDLRPDLLVPETGTARTSRGTVRMHGVRAPGTNRPAAAQVLTDSTVEGLSATVRFEWSALDAWFEEDEEVFVHPRSPYTRVDALRSTRTVRVERDGAVLAESSAPVMVFETGLPTRYYLNRTEVDLGRMIPTDTVTACPYKGTTGGYWSARVADRVHPDIAWSYDFPTREMVPIAGLVAFYNERVDIFLDGELLERPKTPFFTPGD